MKSIVFISHEPYRSFMRMHYFMDEFEQDGYDVEFWCVQKTLKYSRQVNYQHVETADFVTYISDWSTLLSKILALDSETKVCLEIWLVWDTIKLYRILDQKRIKFFSIDYYKNSPISVTRVQKFFRAFIEKRFNDLFKYAGVFLNRSFFKFCIRVLNIKGPSMVFVPGGESKKFGDHVISINHFDFYHFEKSKKLPYVDESSYMVFLDDFITGHPDIERQNRKTISRDVYYEKLNRFFNKLESITGAKVIVAAHPKSNYTDEFSPRLCLQGQTASLIINAKAVIGHHSSSLNYAILAYKPILLIYTKEFLNKDEPLITLLDVYDNMIAYKNRLNCSLINVDEEFSLNDIKSVDIECYNRFVSAIILGTSSRNNYSIIKENIALL